ncbi:LysE family transporter [Streptomyces boluensis]|uniref:LysE family transporter n=1 Tax=Streptomyces boluensis TaxID=1775135 RepID=A0A964UT85_9ACTN|nr:LysE family transporter [Streptomyces boluensis]NBE55008.1 LysE family transporter [Streptomyces boluensis]
MYESVLAGLWAGYGLAVPVGAVAVLMVNMTARTSFRTGFAAALGASTADALYAVAAVLGGAALAVTVRPYAGALRWVAFAVLAALAVRVGRTAFRTRTGKRAEVPPLERELKPLRSYLLFFGLTALNPWPALYFVALILGRQAQERTTSAEDLAYVAAIVLASASWQILLAAGGAVFGRALTGPRGQSVTALVSSGLILALGAGTVLGG